MNTRITTGLAALATIALAATGIAPAQADSAERQDGRRSLATVLAEDGTKLDKNWKDFDIVEQAVLAVLAEKPHSPVGLLTQGGKRATVFVPTDGAFRFLVKGLTGKSPATERATLKAVTSVADVDTLETVLLYHVIAGKTLPSGKVLDAVGSKVTTAQGGKIKITLRQGKVTLVDRDKDAQNAQVVVLDINKGNKQIGHAVNRVLRPVDL
ncbi:fasciclin domain-containing protein [Nocardioides dongkuii]|uniref:fasciclin domain-containing protein n=1 Tax=Nocardioides dongkuii TaxID=2760089 RepID=UPI0015FD48C1|nr:fasciclin domain-containing protein [Nocardioides dongkuii]